jgi:hypothetical protein
MSDMRPDVSAGPMERSFIPARSPVVNFVLSGRAAGFLFDCAPAIVAKVTRKMTTSLFMRVVREEAEKMAGRI